MAAFFPFQLTNGHTVYLNPERIVSIRYNGGFYAVTIDETVSAKNADGNLASISNRVYEVSELPFPLE